MSCLQPKMKGKGKKAKGREVEHARERILPPTLLVMDYFERPMRQGKELTCRRGVGVNDLNWHHPD